MKSKLACEPEDVLLWLRLSDLEFLHFSMQPFGAPAAPAGLGPSRVLMLMLMVIVVVVRSHALGRYCFLRHQLASRSVVPSFLCFMIVSAVGCHS